MSLNEAIKRARLQGATYILHLTPNYVVVYRNIAGIWQSRDIVREVNRWKLASPWHPIRKELPMFAELIRIKY